MASNVTVTAQAHPQEPKMSNMNAPASGEFYLLTRDLEESQRYVPATELSLTHYSTNTLFTKSICQFDLIYALYGRIAATYQGIMISRNHLGTLLHCWYLLDTDKTQTLSLDGQHSYMISLCDGNLVHESIPKQNILSIADVATGTG